MKNLKPRALRGQKLCIWGRPALHVWQFSLQADPCRCWWCPVKKAEITIGINSPRASPDQRDWTGGRHRAGTSPWCRTTGSPDSPGSRNCRRKLLYGIFNVLLQAVVGGGRRAGGANMTDDKTQPGLPSCVGTRHHPTDWFSPHLQLECAEALASTRNQSNTLCRP